MSYSPLDDLLSRPGRTYPGDQAANPDRRSSHRRRGGTPSSLRRMILVGPVLRFVDDTRATIWVETDRAGEIEVLGHTARTWAVHGHHYALVVVTGLEPGTETPYTVAFDGRQVWPPPDSEFPPSVIRTYDGQESFRLAFGSCRRSE